MSIDVEEAVSIAVDISVNKVVNIAVSNIVNIIVNMAVNIAVIISVNMVVNIAVVIQRAAKLRTRHRAKLLTFLFLAVGVLEVWARSLAMLGCVQATLCLGCCIDVIHRINRRHSSSMSLDPSVITHRASFIKHHSRIIRHLSPRMSHESSTIHQSSVINHQTCIIQHH